MLASKSLPQANSCFPLTHLLNSTVIDPIPMEPKMPLAETHFYLGPWYFSNWPYLWPSCVAALALMSFGAVFVGIKRHKNNQRSWNMPTIEHYLRVCLFIGVGLGAALWSFGLFREAYQLKHSQFKTKPYLTLSAQGIIDCEHNEIIYWPEIRDIEYRKKRGKHSSPTGVYIRLRDGKLISFTKEFTLDLKEIAYAMRIYYRKVLDEAS